MGAQTHPDDTENKSVVNFDDDFDRGFAFYPRHSINRSRLTTNVGSPGGRFTGSLQTKALGIAKNTSFGIATVTALLDGIAGAAGVAAPTRDS